MAPIVVTLLVLSAFQWSLADDNCPRKCTCLSSGSAGTPSFTYKVDCAGKLADSDSVPQSIPAKTTELILSNNKLESVSTQEFKILTKLIKLDMSNNRLKKLPRDLFDYAPNLKEVYLSGNPLTCDCELYGVYSISRALSKFSGTCSSGASKPRPIKSLKLWDFCRGCAAVKASGQGSVDGEYFVNVNANCETKARVYCYNMNTGSPQEFITLLSGPQKNFAYIYEYKLPQGAKDQCQWTDGGDQYSEAGLTNFTKVRVHMDLNSIFIVASDFTFSNSASGKRVQYGVAADCYSASKENCRKGRFNIDLTGSGFRLKDDVYWDHYGNPTDIANTLDIDEERRRVYAECGGYCGGCRPHDRLLLELDSCPMEGIKSCYNALGMDDRTITDAQITASSVYSENFKPRFGRLYNVPETWCAGTTDKIQWLQVDIGEVVTLSGVATQGSSDSDSWVTKYKLQYCNDGVSWKNFEEIGQELELNANDDQHSIVTNWFKQRFRARYIRINPTAWNNRICLRAELYGCDSDIVSVIVKHKSDGRCWSPLTSSKPCEPADGVQLNLASFCQGEGVMMKFRQDRTIVHSCSGKCIYKDSKNFLALRGGPCDKFRTNGSDSAIVHEGSKLCVGVDSSKKLMLSDCKGQETLFVFSQKGLQPIRPKFDMPSPQYLTVSKPGWVHCQVTSDPRANIFWSKRYPWPNGDQLNKLEFIEFSNGSLFVRKAQLRYEGKYYCTAANSGGFEFKGVDVKVGATPTLVLGPKNITTQVNRTSVFGCKASGNLAIKISWFKREKADARATFVDKLGERFVLFSNGSLQVRRAQKQDEAFYQCRAENPVGYNTAQAFLRVLVPPRFTTIPRDIQVPSGSSPLISCRAFGDPVPTMSWSKGSSSSLPNHFKVYPNGDLYIKGITKSDEADYACVASNALKRVSHKIALRVYISCRIDPLPNTNIQPDKQFFRVSENVLVRCNNGFEKQTDGNLTCQASGQWDKSMPKCRDIDECRMVPFTKNVLNHTKFHECHEKARCINTPGAYRCQCIDGYDGDGRTCTAVCVSPAEQPNGQWTPQKKYYDIDEMVRMRCNQGYKLNDNGVPSLTCGKDAMWSTALPSCQDVNECSEKGACDDNADCVNTVGSFECECKAGYESDNQKNCKVKKDRSITGSNGEAFKFSRRMDEVAEKIKQLEKNPASRGEVLEVLTNSTSSDEGSLGPGDLLLVVRGLEVVLSSKSALKQQEVQHFLKASSNLLDKRSKESWNKVHKDSKGVSHVMQLLDKLAVEIADGLSDGNASIDLQTENLDMKVTVKMAGDFSGNFRYPEMSQDKKATAQITLPQEVFSTFEADKRVVVTSLLYQDLGDVLPKRAIGAKKFDLNPAVVATSVYPSPVKSDGKLAAPVTIVMKNEQPTQQDAVLWCVYWDFDKNPDMGGSLSDEGCHVVRSGTNGTVCQCNHMTAFTSMAVYDKEQEFTLVMDIGFGILLLAGLIALVRHLYKFCKCRAERSIIHINLCIAILAELGLFVGGLKRTEIRAVCILVAAVLQYFFIAMFCWMLAEGLQLFLTISSGKNRNSKRNKFFFLIGWLVPALAVGVSLGVTQLQGYGNDEWCWLDYSTMLLWAFVGPAGAFIGVCLILILAVACIRNRVVDTDDRRKVSISLLCMFVLIPVMAGTWVVAAIYVKHHEVVMWQYVFAGCCALQGILLLVFCLMDREIKNFTYIYKIKKMQNKEKRNYYSTTDTVQYFGGNNAPDGKNYTVTRPSIKESNNDLRGSSKRLSRLESQSTPVDPEGEYPSPILDTPGTIDSAMQRNIEDNPIPETPKGEVIRLQTYPKRRGADSQSQRSSESVSERRPDGAEYPEQAYADRQSPRSSMPKSMETLLSSHSKLQQIPEREPLLNRGNNYPQSESGMSECSSRAEGRNTDDTDSAYAPSLDSSRRRSRRSRKRLEEEFGKCDRDSISRRKKSLRYSSGYIIGATVEEEQKPDKPHASL